MVGINKNLQDTEALDVANNLVWYVAYGTNMLIERFMVYINGGIFRGKGKAKEVCAEKFPSSANKPFLIPYELYFGKVSKTWDNGGVAFIDADKPGTALGRAYLITEKQFSHIQEQEGASWYKRIIEIGKDANGTTYKTFSGTNRHKTNPPSDSYANVMFEGICETYYPHLPYNRFHRLMNEAIKHLGKPYASSINSNGKGPNAFDCVWFVYHVFSESGVYDNLKKHFMTTFVGKALKKIKATELKREGDVLLFCKPPDKEIKHVGIYIGHNLIIHASQPIPGTGSVRIDDITKDDWSERLVALGRISE